MNTVFIDIDTQLDFVAPAGALYAPGAETITPKLKELTQLAAETGSPIVSTVDAHQEDDPEFKSWKPHCVVGTAGQQKLSVTLRDKRYTVPNVPDALDENAVRDAQQIIFEKQHVDFFTNPNLARLLQRLAPARFLVYGLVTEVCVFYAAQGLLKAGYAVEVIEDAIWPFSAEAGQKALDTMSKSGAERTTADRIVAAMRRC
jgi:nicotinamidase/pyrazinamidase